jgi:restriction system protein
MVRTLQKNRKTILFSLKNMNLFKALKQKLKGLFSYEQPPSSGNHKHNENSIENLMQLANPVLKTIPESHWVTLFRKRRQLLIKDDYGDLDQSLWQKEFQKYYDKYFQYKLPKGLEIAIREHYANDLKALVCGAEFIFMWGCVNMILDSNEKNLTTLLANGLKERPTDPFEYEQFCADILRSSGWQAVVTQATGDQGADIRASKHGLNIIVQCKLYSKPVGNKAVQEVVGALAHYGAKHGLVVTNTGFTKSAKMLAASNNILLLNDAQLHQLSDQDFK